MNKRLILIILAFFVAQHTLTLHDARREVYFYVLNNNLMYNFQTDKNINHDVPSINLGSRNQKLDSTTNSHEQRFESCTNVFDISYLQYYKNLYTCLQEFLFILIKPAILGIKDIYIYIYTISFVLPLTLLYLQGPLLAGFGFYQGKSLIDICSVITKVEAAFWAQHTEKCNDLIYLQVNSFILTCHMSIIGVLLLIFLGLYIFDWIWNRMTFNVMTLLHNSTIQSTQKNI